MSIVNLVTKSLYEYPSNFSNGTEVDGIGNLFVYLNSALNGLLGWMLLLSIGLIMFLTLKGSGYPASKSLASVSFVLTLIATTLMMMGILSFQIVMILVIVTIVLALTTRAESNVGL